MTTNKPDVKRYNMTADKYDHPAPYETEHGQWVKYSSYKALQDECDSLRKDAERYRWLRDPCSGAERVVTYGRGGYGRGLMSYTMLDGSIDDAMEKSK